VTITAPPRRIEYRRVRDLVANPTNPKKHDLDLIASSIDEHGYIEPVVEDGRTGRLISGHGRNKMLAAREAEGADPPDGVVIDAAGYWQVPVAVGWSSRDDAEADAALVALNRAGEVGGWDERKLLDLLTGLAEQDRLQAVGFDESDIADLRAYLDATDLTGEPIADLDMDLGKVPVRDGQAEVVVVYDTARRDDLYTALHGYEWVIDVRDRKISG
jgi:ParB-like chromosome segregation protein Spo0J